MHNIDSILLCTTKSRKSD